MVQEADLAVGDVIKLGDTYLQLTTFKDSIPDAVTGGKITDPRVAGAITAQSDSPGWQTPEPAPASSYAVTPSPDDVSTFSSTDRLIIDTDELHRARKSDMAVIFDRMRMEEEYLELATETLHRFICPDRAVILKKTEQKRLASERVFLNPALDPAHHQSPPVLPLVKRAMKTRRVAMDNKVESPPDQQLAASALVVPVLQGDEAVGAVYIDCFPRSRKIFMETDFELLERIAEVLAIRWNEG